MAARSTVSAAILSLVLLSLGGCGGGIVPPAPLPAPAAGFTPGGDTEQIVRAVEKVPTEAEQRSA